MDDPAEFTRLIPQFADLHALLFASAEKRDQVRARRDEVYRRHLGDPEISRVTAAVAEAPDGTVVGFRAGALYTGSQSLWRDSFGGPLLVPRGDERVPVGDATREQWAEKPVPHGLEVAVHPDYQGHGLGRELAGAWGDARPGDEEYATGHIAPTNAPSLSTFRHLGAQIIGTRENGRYFYLLPLKGQSRHEVDLEVAAIQNDTVGLASAMRGLGDVRDLAQHTSAASHPQVALPIDRAIEQAVATQHEQGR
ncbi:MAG: GNAT family N-acetyltransferase [Streptomycetaceae bacterium]|nr:GNAT family N-acetyltransferase [Streptomycetaceae bacterium]